MKKFILSVLDKKTNRLSRLNDYRRVKSLTTENSIGTFEIEVSPKALDKLKNVEKKIRFSFEEDFGIKDGEKKAYWIRFNGEYPNKKTDFTYFCNGYIKRGQHSGFDNWGIQVVFSHIDVSVTWGQLNALVEMVAKFVDKKYGDDCGFKDKWQVDVMKIDFIKNK